MSLIGPFLRGLGTALAKSRLVAYLWPVNFVFAAILVSPVVVLIGTDFGRSLSAERVGRLDFMWLGDVVYKYSAAAPALAGLILIGGMLFVLVSLFLNGGIIGRIAAAGDRTTLASFFADCGKYFWRFFRVFLATVVSYALVFGAAMKLVALPFNAVVRGASGEWPVIIASNLNVLVTLLVWTVIQMFFDYVKIRLVAEDSRKTIRAALATASMLRRTFFRAWGLYLLVGCLFLAGSAGFAVIESRWLSGRSILFAGLLWGQAYVVFRLWTKVLFFATEFQLSKDRGLPGVG